MSLSIHLLGQPRILSTPGDGYVFRSRKSWALLAYLILNERPPARSELAGLLFGDAQDPVRALRWSLTEVRRGLGDGGSVDGDPVVLRLAPDATVDVNVVSTGSAADAVRLPALGCELLTGVAVKGAAAFDTWLLAKQRKLAAASEAILHEAALTAMSRGDLDNALSYAVRAAALSPLDENHHALLIRIYRRAGDDRAAARQLDACTEAFASELGIRPGPAVLSAMQTPRDEIADAVDEATIAALVESGSAAVAAGATDAGVQSLRAAARYARAGVDVQLQVRSRLVLAEALIHSLRGLDEEGLAALYEADEIGRAAGLQDVVAQVRAELGYVDFLRGRCERAEHWLTDALELANGSSATVAKATTYLGAVESDRGNYPRAQALLESAVDLAHTAGDHRLQAFALSMLGRLGLLRGDVEAADAHLDAAIAMAEHEHWLAFLPWPQSLKGEIRLAHADVPGAEAILRQAFARACQLGDPCWEGMSARGLALVAEARGAVGQAFDLLAEARTRCNRLADPYVWLDGYILDAQCELGRRHAHPDARRWVEALRQLASRAGMQEFTVRSLLHGAALGIEGDAAAAALLAPRGHVRRTGALDVPLAGV